ncbi:MAG: HAMP domain-containing sensor histidine kinase [Actinomycetaceae bacterium]|nr:HAMP domain-containing sensor histidine kinase [Actinomycetaceae bacterium]
MNSTLSRVVIAIFLAAVVVIPLFVGGILGFDNRLAIEISVVFVAALLVIGCASVFFALRWVRHLRQRSFDEGAQVAREEARELHRRFLQRLDHELKNPLTAIRAATADARTVPASYAIAERLDVVDAQGRRMGRLLADLRKLADIDTAPLDIEDVDLVECARDTLEALADQISGAGHSVVLDVPTVPWPLPHIRGDADLIYSAVHNLIANAVKYTPGPGRIEVRGREESGAITIEVADTGIGVPASDLPDVWGELARASNSTGLSGSGLGLALVASIAHRHDGSCGISSVEGLGTRTWLTLPIAGPRL